MSSGANAFEISDFQEDETAVWFARIKSAFEMNSIQRGRVTCDIYEVQLPLANCYFARDRLHLV